MQRMHENWRSIHHSLLESSEAFVSSSFYFSDLAAKSFQAGYPRCSYFGWVVRIIPKVSFQNACIYSEATTQLVAGVSSFFFGSVAQLLLSGKRWGCCLMKSLYCTRKLFSVNELYIDFYFLLHAVHFTRIFTVSTFKDKKPTHPLLSNRKLNKLIDTF